VWITKDEDKRLNKKYKSKRSSSSYNDVGIEIHNEQKWNTFYENI